MKSIQENLLEYLDNDANNEKYYQNLSNILESLETRNDKYLLKSLLYFFSKIEKIIQNFTQKTIFIYLF